MKTMKKFAKFIVHIKLTMAFIILGNIAIAQLYCNDLKSESGDTTKCLHENKQVSSIIEWDKEQRWGKLSIYKSDGSLIQEWELRKIHGTSSVDLEYHANGQVSKVDYRSAPDGGIQRFHRYYYYDQNGTLVNTVRNDYPAKLDDILRFEETSKPTNTAACAEIWTSVMLLQNSTKKTQKIKIIPVIQNSQTKERVTILKRNQIITVDSCFQAQFFQDPIKNVKIEFMKTRNNPTIMFKESSQPAKTKSIYVYELK